MKKRTLVMLSGIILMPFSLWAQRMVPYSFQYQGDSTQQGIMKVVSNVSYPNAESIRLYFEDVSLGDKSYLLLEGPDGAQQRLDARALRNWHNTSAYFNGDKVKISVYQAKGDPRVAFELKEVKVSEENAAANVQQMHGASLITQTSTTPNAAQIHSDIPYGKAIGRLTNGNKVGGAGWISPNGAIVTSREGYRLVEESGFDIIEFNVPLSNNDLSVNHPAPEDQYPLNLDGAVYTSRHVQVKRYDGTPYDLERALGFAVIEALPNSTGLTPGERQGEYFIIALNPEEGSAEGVDVDIYSYTGLFDIYLESDHSYNFALQKRSAGLVRVKSHVEKYTPNTEEILLYPLYGRNIHEDAWSYHTGGPVTYKDSNVAIGVHEAAFFHDELGSTSAGPSIGNGFRHGIFRNSLNDFFTSNVVYVDAIGIYGTDATGEIHTPYNQLMDGASAASANAIIFIAKGNYNESVTINTPMTLKAPVGVVKIGSSESNSARMAQFPSPVEPVAEFEKSIFEENENKSFSEILVHPNPFTDRAEIQYALPVNTPVLIKVFDSHGNEIKSLLHEAQEAGEQTVMWDGLNKYGQQVTKGVYFLKIHTGNHIKTVRILKQ